MQAKLSESIPPKSIKHPFLKGFPKKYHKDLLRNAKILNRKEGRFVFRDGERARHFYLILKGQIDILTKEQDVRLDPEATTAVLIHLKSGDIVGWSWIIPPFRWRFDSKVETDTCLLALDGTHLRKKASRDYRFAYEIYKRLVPVMNERMIAARMRLIMGGARPCAAAEGA